MTRKGTNLGGTRPCDVDSHHELGVAVLDETAAALIDRLIESDGGTLGQQCRLDRHKLVGLHSFADGDDIRFRHMAEIPLEDPDADPCVALREEDYRI